MGRKLVLFGGRQSVTLDSAKIGELTEFTLHIRSALEGAGIYGENGGVIDHIELFGPLPIGRCAESEFRTLPRGGL